VVNSSRCRHQVHCQQGVGIGACWGLDAITEVAGASHLCMCVCVGGGVGGQ
jgi:hypothetical protein